MSKVIKRRRNAYFVGAILLVVFLFSYYFFAYIPQREADMNERGMRVMKRMVKNITEREEHYVKSINLFECDYLLKGLLENYNATDKRSFSVFEEVLKKADCQFIRDSIVAIAEKLAIDRKFNLAKFKIKGTTAEIEPYLYFVEQAIDIYISRNINSDPIVEFASFKEEGKFMFKHKIKLDNDFHLKDVDMHKK